jgi:DMSO reductase family type II enzyme chaperone
MTDEKRTGREKERTDTARAVIYRFLSRCFSYPDRELMELFNSARLEEFLQAWHYLSLDTEEAIAMIANWLAQYPDYETALLELDKEYTRLFITAYPKTIAPPYSSVYLDSEQLVWGKSTAEVARLYEAAGLSINEHFHDIPDHIGAELEFASYLIVEQQKSKENAPIPVQELASIERRFLTDHLLRWTPAFFSRVAECSRLTFYHVTASLSRQFVEEETKHLSR